MNFLAHIYLSGSNPDVIIGNFIGDHIKGKAYKYYPDDLRTGILLHREIDTFTDAHPIVKQSTKRLHKNFSHWSGIIVDMFYDHFLAKNWSNYSDIPLEIYTANFYKILEDQLDSLPEKIQLMTPYLIRDNWLLSYSSTDGLQKALEGLNRRTGLKSKMNESMHELQIYYDDFEKEFTAFFNELIQFSADKLKILSSQH